MPLLCRWGKRKNCFKCSWMIENLSVFCWLPQNTVTFHGICIYFWKFGSFACFVFTACMDTYISYLPLSLIQLIVAGKTNLIRMRARYQEKMDSCVKWLCWNSSNWCHCHEYLMAFKYSIWKLNKSVEY